MAPSPGKLDCLLTCGMTLWVFIYSSCGALSSSGSYRSFLDCDFPFSSTLSIYSNCSIDSYLRNSYDTSPLFFSDYIWSKTIPRVLPVLLILFLKCIQPLSGQCSYLGNLILIALQVYGILDTMLLLQPDGPQLGDPLRWCGICIATSGFHIFCTRFILRLIGFIRDDHLRGALIEQTHCNQDLGQT